MRPILSEDTPPPALGLNAVTALLEHLPLPILLLDRHDCIRFANAPVVHLFGYARTELLGRSVTALFPRLRFKRAPDAALTVQGTRKDGTQGQFCLKCSRIEAGAESLAVCVIEEDFTTTDVQNLALTETRLREAQQIVKLGSWTWDIQTDTHWWSEELYRMLEVQPDGSGPHERFLEMVHPQDRARLDEVRERIFAGEPTGPVDVRIRLPSGEERVIQTRGRATCDAAGRALMAHGTLQDITEQRFTQSALRLTELRYRETQRLAQIGNWEWDLSTGRSWWSHEMYQILEEDPQHYAADFDNFLARVHPADRSDLQRRRTRIAMGPNAYQASDIRLLLRDGREKIVHHSVEVRVNDAGQPTAVVGTIHDATERRALEAQLRDSEARYSGTVELAAVGIAHVAADGRLIWSNGAMREILGYSKEELEHLTVWDISHPEDVHVTDHERVQMHSGALDSLRTEKRYVRKDGGIIWVKIACAPRRDEHGKLLYDISVVEDITPRKAAEARVQYLATHDELTGLANRALFMDTLSRAIDAARANGGGCALIFIDLDRFKIVNDSLGHDAGDQLLKEVALRIGRCVGAADVIARFGGDEFVVLLDQICDRAAITATAGRILSAMREPVRVLSHDCRVTASIGIAVFPQDAADAAALMKRADIAMYLAKDEGKNNFQFYADAVRPMSVERIVLETQLVNALQRQEFSLHYQPKIDIATGRICGVEALLRWRNGQLGSVAPSDFIALAEDIGLIIPIGRWVLRTACAQSIVWQRRGLPPLGMAVNLSPRQFKDPGLAQDVSGALRASGLAPQLLELEITESMIMNRVDQARDTAAAIKALGVRLAIDDFGTGYSSLSQLKRFPIDTLKIDRSFIRGLPQNAEDTAIIEAIISLGRALRVNIVAEGVETKEQEAFLRSRVCNQIQGFLYGEPCDAEGFVELFRRMNPGDGTLAV